MVLEDEILKAKGKNWAKLVAEKADQISKTMQDDVDYMIKLLSGEIFDRAVNEVAFDIRQGLYDDMLMPKEYNL